MDLEIRAADSYEAEAVAGLMRKAFKDVAVTFGLTRENCPTHPSNYTEEWVSRDMGASTSWLRSRTYRSAAWG